MSDESKELTLPEKADRELQEWWEEARNGYKSVAPIMVGIINFCEELGIFDEEKAELWRLRMEKCPGHDPCRAWCAYCGNIPEEPEQEVTL